MATSSNLMTCDFGSIGLGTSARLRQRKKHRNSLNVGDKIMKSNVVFRPTVVIGLGGTGHGAVLKLKKRFMDAYGSVPPIISFVSIDTTENVEHSERTRDGAPVTLEPNSERYVLSVANPGALVSGTN